MKRKLSIVLLLAMFASLAVSCNGDSGDSKNTDTGDIAVTTDPADNIPEDQRLDLDPDLDFGGKTVNILTYENTGKGSDTEQASVLNRTIYMQRVRAAERVGVEVTFKDAATYKDVPNMVTQSINTQTDDYQLVFSTASRIVGLVNSGYFVSVNDLTHVNLDKVWWNKEYSESVSINSNSPYVLFGDITWKTVDRTCAVLFNKDLLLEHHGMTDSELYDIVLDGKWTIDKMAELCTTLYIDDGDNTQDMDDVHGVTFNGKGEFEYMAYSAGLVYTERNEDGYPVIAEAPSERMIAIVDKILPIYKSNSAFANGSLPANSYATKFGNGNALFLPSRLFVAGWSQVTNMEDDYGIIPMPKFDETIDGYHSVVGELVSWALVPNTVTDLDMSSAFAEALAYEGYQTSTPTYYEETLKLKTTRGDDIDTESQIIDLIRYGARTDFLYLNRLNGLGSIFGSCYDSNSNNMSSNYATYYRAANQALTQIIETLENNN